MKRNRIAALLISALWVTFFAISANAGTDDILNRWSKSRHFENDLGSELDITVTYYSSEYIEALVQNEAEKNLWTADEAENYKYELLKGLQLDEYVPVHLEFESKGPAMHMAPFDRQIVIWMGNKKYTPVDYDKRFNFKLMGKRDGLVYFPRFDEKSGKSLLENAKRVKVSISGSISSTTEGIATVDFSWDVDNDDPARLLKGKAAAQLEMDRLIKRIEKLSGEKSVLEAQLAEIQAELDRINERIEELRKQ